MSDSELFQQVLDPSTNAVVTIILGTKDRVVPPRQVRKFLSEQTYPRVQVRVVEMEGLGHDPFEEDVEDFLTVLEEVLEDDGNKIFGRQP